MIKLINYNFINPLTTIKINFGGIQSLPPVLVNTLSIGVLINYNDINSSTYLYIPTPTLPKVTNTTLRIADHPADWHNNWYMTVAYSGVNIVLQPTTFSFAIGYVPYWYNYYYTYSSSATEDQFIVMKFTPKTIIDPNNPVPIACGSCTDV
jgi:hypothetical protein